MFIIWVTIGEWVEGQIGEFENGPSKSGEMKHEKQRGQARECAIVSLKAH